MADAGPLASLEDDDTAIQTLGELRARLVAAPADRPDAALGLHYGNVLADGATALAPASVVMADALLDRD